MKIILASGSPRRRELLKLIYDEFEVRISDADETVPKNIPAEKTAEYLSSLKAESVMHNADELIIACDTVVVIDGRVLGKPSNEEECREMLRLLSSRIHTVYTGVTILYGGKSHSFTSETEVEFYPLSYEEMSEYIKTGESFDKAGGYGIQGKGALLVKRINGDFYNVVGLPVSALKHELTQIID